MIAQIIFKISSISFTLTCDFLCKQKKNKLFFLEVQIIGVIEEQGKFITTIYRKPTFSGLCSNFAIFLPSIFKLSVVYTLVYRCFCICSNSTQFHTKITFPEKEWLP